MTYRLVSDDIKHHVLALVGQEPGIWTAKLCRLVNRLPETEESIIYCGLCKDYANMGKRKRAAYYASMPTLPGFEPPYQIHPPCRSLGLKQVQYTLRWLADNTGMLRGEREVIPDPRTPRGWDFATRWEVT